MKKAFIFLLIISIISFPLSAFAQENEKLNMFTDTIGHWAEGYINEVVELGFFKGTGDNLFNPDDRVSRAQFMTVLYRMSGAYETDKATPFLDISLQPEEFKNAISWGYNSGYISGVSETEFDPEGFLTREAAMKILFQYSGGQSGGEILFTVVYDDLFLDSDYISDWAKPCVYWGVYNKLISGTEPKILNPNAAVTRAQLAKILIEYYNYFNY